MNFLSSSFQNKAEDKSLRFVVTQLLLSFQVVRGPIAVNSISQERLEGISSKLVQSNNTWILVPHDLWTLALSVRAPGLCSHDYIQHCLREFLVMMQILHQSWSTDFRGTSRLGS